jgi:Ca2+-binding RTX toxin-like protein
MKLKLVTLVVVGAAALVVASLAMAARVHGTGGNDTLNGTNRADIVAAFAGDDTVNALGGRDLVYGGPGNDTIDAGNGIDVVLGGEGNDTILGGNGPDLLRGRAGDDTVDGGDGRDVLFGGWGTDTLRGGAGNDRLHAVAKDGQLDTLDCGPGNRDVAVVRAGEPVSLNGCEIIRTVPADTPGQGEPGEPANGS